MKPGPIVGAVTSDAAATSPLTVVLRPLLVSVAPPAGPTSTPKVAAAPMSTGPGPLQLAGGTGLHIVAATVKFHTTSAASGVPSVSVAAVVIVAV